jgi:TFIIF-interacting CTD phosphatase-like protein
MIFTAGVQDYADPLIDLIDPNGFITKRHYRDVRFSFFNKLNLA